MRKRYNSGYRCPGHDYRAKCIYHIVLQKREGVEDFSRVEGEVGSHENPPRARRSPAGEAVASGVSSLKAKYPFAQILRRCIMPDHVHMALYVSEATETHLGLLVKHIKNECYRLSGRQMFADNYHDTILSAKGQLKRMLAYVSDNPRRHLVRRRMPGFFHRFTISDGSEILEAYGNWDLLAEPELVAVKAGRDYAARSLELSRLWRHAVWNDGVLVSPFISPVEKRVRDWAIGHGGALIYLISEELAERYKPGGELFELCAEGRLLVVSIPHHSGSFREHCRRMNALAARIAAGDFSPSGARRTDSSALLPSGARRTDSSAPPGGSAEQSLKGARLRNYPPSKP